MMSREERGLKRACLLENGDRSLTITPPRGSHMARPPGSAFPTRHNHKSSHPPAVRGQVASVHYLSGTPVARYAYTKVCAPPGDVRLRAPQVWHGIKAQATGHGQDDIATLYLLFPIISAHVRPRGQVSPECVSADTAERLGLWSRRERGVSRGNDNVGWRQTRPRAARTAARRINSRGAPRDRP
ncbi:hypothetical protein Bbelb_411880 [Branchiostoma belcheri]|nr:hypothetical protein Bbelb_411880 [Branchiostoma belcheri]